MARSEVLRELRNHIAPVTLAREHCLAVPGPLAPLLPRDGIQKGQTLGFAGSGSWSIALAMAGAAVGNDGWLAIVNAPEVGLCAAGELGVDLERVLVIESVPGDRIPTALAAMNETIDLILLGPHPPLSHRDVRRLSARNRERGTVIFHLDSGRNWPSPLDISFTVTNSRWFGLGDGHGYLQWRQLDVEATGRRAAAQTRRASIALPELGS